MSINRISRWLSQSGVASTHTEQKLLRGNSRTAWQGQSAGQLRGSHNIGAWHTMGTNTTCLTHSTQKITWQWLWPLWPAPTELNWWLHCMLIGDRMSIISYSPLIVLFVCFKPILKLGVTTAMATTVICLPASLFGSGGKQIVLILPLMCDLLKLKYIHNYYFLD